MDHVEITPLAEQLAREVSESRRDALNRQEMVEPNEEERANGWDAKSLPRYLAERQASQSLAVDVNSLHRQIRPDEQNHRYRVLRWRE